MKLLVTVLLSLMLFGFLFDGGLLNAQNKITPKLVRKLQSADKNEFLPVWIFFTDKGPDWKNKLPEVERNLLPRARARRLRNRPHNQLVDIHDVPVQREYIQTVANYVGRIRHKSRWLNAVSAEATPGQIEILKSVPFVNKLDIIYRFKRPELPPADRTGPQSSASLEHIHTLNYGPSYTQNQLINVPPLHDLGYDGSGVLICMLDAGFNNLQHDALAPIDVLETWDFVNGDSIVWDQPGQAGSGDHGTWTLGSIAGYAPGHLIGPAYGASFILGKTENTDSETHIEEDNWVAGAEWADSLGADIISSSLGYRDFDFPQLSYSWQDMNGDIAISTRGADIAASRGILVVNSAGNEGPASPGNPNTLVAPADGDSVLAAGAVNSSGLQAYFSSEGPTADGRIKPDVMALGVSVVVPSTFGISNYTTNSGTSFSCPLTAGAAALILQVNPTWTNMQLIEALRQTAGNSSFPNNTMGWGIVNAQQAASYTPTGVENRNPHIWSDFKLFSNYPNPFNLTTTVQFRASVAGDVNVAVFNNLGQKVAALVDGFQSAGQHQIQWDAGNLASGIYYIVLKAQNRKFVRKAILMK